MGSRLNGGKMYSVRNRRGFVLVMTMIVFAVLATWVVSISSMCNTNLQLAHNQHKVNSALSAAESSLECGRYIMANTLSHLPSTGYDYVTTSEADMAWAILCNQVQAQPWVNDGAQQTAEEIITPTTSYSQDYGAFKIRFYRENTHTVQT